VNQKGQFARDRTQWGHSADEIRHAHADLVAAGAIIPRSVGFAWGDAVDAISRAILALATGEGWVIRAVVGDRAYAISADGQRELALVMEFQPNPRVTHALTGDGRDLSPVEALDYLGASDAAGE
jgi:hypothetical protein